LYGALFLAFQVSFFRNSIFFRWPDVYRYLAVFFSVNSVGPWQEYHLSRLLRLRQENSARDSDVPCAKKPSFTCQEDVNSGPNCNSRRKRPTKRGDSTQKPSAKTDQTSLTSRKRSGHLDNTTNFETRVRGEQNQRRIEEWKNAYRSVETDQSSIPKHSSLEEIDSLIDWSLNLDYDTL